MSGRPVSHTVAMAPDARSAADATPAAATLLEIAGGVFAWVQPDGSWWINNAGAIAGVGDDGTHPGGTIVIDTCATYERTRRFLDAVADATDDAPVTMAANTHQHGDHTYGNSLLPASTVLFGHREMRAELLADTIIDSCPPAWEPVPDWGPVTRRVPSVAVDQAVTLFGGSRRVELRHPGYAAHTTGDLVAWLPEERILFAGDLLFHGLTPLVFMGSLDGARRALQWLVEFDAQQIVPGHGPLIGTDEIDDVLAVHERYYNLVGTAARIGMGAGRGALDAARLCRRRRAAAALDRGVDGRRHLQRRSDDDTRVRRVRAPTRRRRHGLAAPSPGYEQARSRVLSPLARPGGPAASRSYRRDPATDVTSHRRRKDKTMAQQAWSDKRERQYEHIKSGLRERGEDEDVAEEIAARTVNKERARAGETVAASRTSTDDISSSRRGGLRSHRGRGGRTRDQLYAEAKAKGVAGRSTMNKHQLEAAVDGP